MIQIDDAAKTELMAVFVGEAETRLGLLLELTESLRDRGVDAEKVAALGRTLHGLKGSAATIGVVGFVGFEALSHHFHRIEDIVVGLPQAADETLARSLQQIETALSCILDGVLRIAAAGETTFPEDVLDRLARLLDSESATVADRSRERRPPAKAKPNAATPGDAGSVPVVETSRADGAIDRLLVSALDVDTVVRDVAWISRGLTGIAERVQGDEGLARAISEMRTAAELVEERLFGLRLLPASTALAGLDLEIADLAARLGKQVCLAVRGREIRADRRTLQAARSLLRHLLRNAVDHGLESPEERVRQGKPPEGSLAVTLDASTGVLRVTVQDDGRGFDLPAIRDQLSETDAEGTRRLSDEEVLRRFAFAGGSTRSLASELSGRGLGLSAVARAAHAAGGMVEIRTRSGLGSEITFALPLDVFAMDVLIVLADGEKCALPLKDIEATVSLANFPTSLRHALTGRVLVVDEQIIPAIAAAELFGHRATDDQSTARFAVVVRAEGKVAALLVDELGTVQGVVPTPAADLAGLDDIVLGLARLADGALVAVLSPAALVESAEMAAERVTPDAAPRINANTAVEVLLVEDSAATREVLRSLLEAQGFRVRIAADGEEALVRLHESKPHVIVSDVNMPRLNGFGLVRRLRADPSLATIPVVLLTSNTDEASRAEGIAAGANAYLVKAQFTAAVLRDTLARLGLKGA